ncbi:MAG: DNA topoisomerase I [Candidatus ainarchaeum sp.]|nr:DNA topoisomerase I [Candidatus ainarchaeum sp.]
MNLIISEKAIAGKRIASILSKNKFETINENGVNTFSFTLDKKEYLVIPLRGHINSVDFIDGDTHWSAYNLDILADKQLKYAPTEKAIITTLKKKRELEKVIIATDADREGEAIGVEAYNYVIEKNNKFKLKRAYFSALTEKEIIESFKEEQLREVDFNYADSVFTREEIDLLWGAILTRYLSVVANRKGKMFLSAGRVQTPLLNFIVERELERNSFTPEKYIELDLTFQKDKATFTGTHKDGKIFDLKKAIEIFEKIKDEKTGVVKTINKKEKILKRPDPFNTTSFLRAAAAIGINTNQAMNLAESLYQQGFISYPRTDNTVYPQSINFLEILNALSDCPETDIKKVIKEIEQKPINPSRGPKETTDHPPIYPVAYSSKIIGAEKKVYDLIVRRFLATLYIDAKTENISAIIDVKKEPFVVTGQRILEIGWKKIYVYSKINEVILPDLKVGDIVDIIDKKKQQKETTPPDHYTEGGLIKLMEEQNLGTKSTRPVIIKKLKDRGYVQGTKSIVATNIAIAVCSVLNKHCQLITKPKLTAMIEEEMDVVAAGKKKKTEVVDETREILKDIIKILVKEKQEISQELRTATRYDNTLGKCVLCGKDLIVRISKNNKQFAACSGYPNCKNTFPLPQKYKVEGVGKVCEECKYPIIKILTRRGGIEVCLNHKCKLRIEQQKEYEEKLKEKQEAKEEKAKIKAEKNAEKEKIKTEKIKQKETKTTKEKKTTSKSIKKKKN